MKKQLIAASLIALMSLGIASPVLADDFGINRLVKDTQQSINQASRTAQRKSEELGEFKKRADQMIDNRINELNKLLTRIQADKRLSAGEKISISQDVQNDINGLTALKAKIDADNDLVIARTDAKQIVANFKIFVVEVPKIRLLIATDNLSALAANLQGLTPKLQDLLNKLKSQGKDVSAAQPFLDDINSKLQSITSKLAADKTTVLGVSITSADPHATFASVRQDLASIRASFAQIRHDIGQMREVLSAIIK